MLGVSPSMRFFGVGASRQLSFLQRRSRRGYLLGVGKQLVLMGWQLGCGELAFLNVILGHCHEPGSTQMSALCEILERPTVGVR